MQAAGKVGDAEVNGVVLLVAGHARPAPVSAQASAVAERFFSASSVPAGGELVVTIAPRRYGYFAQVVETLPAGFSYVRSTQPGVEVNGQEVTITLLKNDTVTYTVTVPSAAGDAVFSGVLTDPDLSRHQLGGQSRMTTLVPGASLLERYDADGSGFIDKDEYLVGLADYISDAITKDAYLEIVALYIIN